MAYTPDVNEIKEEVAEQVDDFDEEEWEENLDKYSDKFSEFGDDDFVAWAVSYVAYGVEIESDFSLPGSGGGGGGGGSLPDDLEVVNTEDVENLEYDEDNNSEQFILEGYVLGRWSGETRNGNAKESIRLQDTTGAVTINSYGENNIENMVSADPQLGDFVRVKGVSAFTWVDDETGDRGYGVSCPYWAEFEFESKQDAPFHLENIAKDYVDEIINPGDFVYMKGMVTDKSFNEYQGCAECMKKYDPDEYRVCPNCAHDEMTTYEPGSIMVTRGGKTATVSFSPSDEFNVEDPLFSEVAAYGTYEIQEYDGKEYKQIDVTFCELVDEDDDIEMNSETEESEEEIEEVVEEESEEESESSTEINGNYSEELEEIEDRVQSFGHEMPAMAGIRLLTKKFNIEDEGEQVDVMSQLRDLDSIQVTEDEDEGHTIENCEWNYVMLEAV